MKRFFPSFQYSGENGRINWVGTLQTAKSLPVYKVKIEFYMDKSPKVKILTPSINPKALHRYPDGSLCLYCPADTREQKWTQDSIIAKTILSWTAAWLYFYEYWQETGVWYNEETPHHDTKKFNKHGRNTTR